MKKVCSLAILVILLTLCTIGASAEEANQVTVSIPRFAVRVAGEVVDNVNSKYPCIIYGDQLYMPIKDNYLNAIGYANTPKEEMNYNINSLDSLIPFVNELGGEFNLDMTYTAWVSKDTVTVFDEIKSFHSTDENPILSFNGIAYIPLNARTALFYNWDLTFSAEEGFGIAHQTKSSAVNIDLSYLTQYEDYEMFRPINILDCTAHILPNLTTLVASNQLNDEGRESVLVEEIGTEYYSNFYAYESSRDISLIDYLQINDKLVKFIEIYKEEDELVFDLMVANHEDGHTKVLESGLRYVDKLIDIPKQIVIWDKYCAYLLHDEKEKKTKVFVYNDETDESTMIDEFDYYNYKGYSQPRTIALSAMNGKLFYTVIEDTLKKFAIKQYDLVKGAFIEDIKLKSKEKITFVYDISFDEETKKLAIVSARVSKDNRNVSRDIGFFDIETGDYEKYRSFKDNTLLLLNDSFNYKNGILTYALSYDEGKDKYRFDTFITNMKTEKEMKILENKKIVNLDGRYIFQLLYKGFNEEKELHIFQMDFSDLLDSMPME